MQPVWILAACLATPIVGTEPIHALALPVAPLAGAVDEVVIETADDLKLVGNYYAPKKKGQLAPAAVVVHSVGADRKQMTEVAERLHKLGFGVLSLDLRGHGDSKKKTGLDWDKLDDDGRSALWQLAVRDVEAASRWVLSQDGVHTTNLNLVGYESGCTLAVRHAVDDENVRSVALMSPRSKEYGFDVEADLKELGGLPTLVLTRKDASGTERMVNEANAVTHDPYIELMFSSTKQPSVIEDKKTPSKVSSWLKDVAMPKKGRG